MTICVGLMSGTSLDGVDAVACEIDGDVSSPRIKPLANAKMKYPAKLRERLLAISVKPTTTAEICLLNTEVAEVFSKAAIAVMNTPEMKKRRVDIIGSHGQTIWHAPEKGATLQIGSGPIIAARTGVRTWFDFRQADMARGGQGAPLAPIVHAPLFGDSVKSVVALNLGGIANLTHIPAGTRDLKKLLACDSGPGNMLIDHAVQKAFGKSYDKGGAAARLGKVDDLLLEDLLSHPYFSRKPPKSTGREEFGPGAIEKRLGLKIKWNKNTIATMTELTAVSVGREIKKLAKSGRRTDRLVICGGGAKNKYLVERIAANIGNGVEVVTSAKTGIPPEIVEGLLMALLAWYADKGVKLDLSDITGAKGGPAPLGVLAPA